MKMVTFQIDQERYALPVEVVSSIERVPLLRPIPMAPAHVIGLINLRGVVMTVVDVRKLLELPLKAMGEDTRLLVIGDIAYLVDAADDVQEMDETQLEMPQGEGKLMQGVWHMGDQLVMVLRPEMLRDMMLPTK